MAVGSVSSRSPLAEIQQTLDEARELYWPIKKPNFLSLEEIADEKNTVQMICEAAVRIDKAFELAAMSQYPFNFEQWGQIIKTIKLHTHLNKVVTKPYWRAKAQSSMSHSYSSWARLPRNELWLHMVLILARYYIEHKPEHERAKAFINEARYYCKKEAPILLPAVEELEHELQWALRPWWRRSLVMR